MKRFFAYLLCSFLLAGCAGKQFPDWRYTGANEIEDFKKSYLTGDEKIAALHFSKAAEVIKKTGNLDILGRTYLIEYAVETAALSPGDDRRYLAVAAVQSTPENTAFYYFLKGDFAHMDTRYLPSQYQSLAESLGKGDQTDLVKIVAAIDDPLSRLIAAGTIVLHRPYTEKLLQTAVDTASANGWKKVLLAYLLKLEDYYRTRQETAKAELVRKRMELLK